MGLGRLTSNLITHTNMHKLNNKLVNVELKHFGARMSHGQTQIHKTHHNSDLGEAATSPHIVYFVHGHGPTTKCQFVLRLPNGIPEIPKIPKIGTFTTLRAHIFVCKPLMEMRSKAKF